MMAVNHIAITVDGSFVLIEHFALPSRACSSVTLSGMRFNP